MRTLTFAILLCVLCSIAVAEEHRMSPEQRRERIETVIIGKFAEELDLSPEQAERFYPRLRQFRHETDDMRLSCPVLEPSLTTCRAMKRQVPNKSRT
ncbi:MAG: hypothetical protein IPG71_06935 [bacterium]|nr:hypothetical protein [bacterium]